MTAATITPSSPTNTVLGKLATPVNHCKIKTPSLNHVGVKHHADGVSYYKPIKEAVKMPAGAAANIKPPTNSAKYKWTKVDGAWKKVFTTTA